MAGGGRAVALISWYPCEQVPATGSINVCCRGVRSSSGTKGPSKPPLSLMEPPKCAALAAVRSVVCPLWTGSGLPDWEIWICGRLFEIDFLP